MLTVLLESRAKKPRPFGGALASALLHGALIATAVALTLPHQIDATPTPQRDSTVIYVPVDVHRDRLRPQGPTTQTAEPQVPQVPPSIPMPTFTPPELPAVDVGPVIPPEQIRIGGPTTPVHLGGGSVEPSTLGGAGGVIDETAADRAPRILGRAMEPRYPAQLRDAGLQGRVVVQFVVDTLGRAELDDMQIIASPHVQFSESVRAALALYRFAPGEAAGHKVRTRVQIPFDFTLTK